MKENWKYKKLFYLMLMIVVFSLAVTAIIVSGLIEETEGEDGRYWFFEESIQTGKNVELANAYVYTNENGQLEFLYDNVTYIIEGHLSQAYTGVADIVVDGEQIAKVRIKPDSTDGILHAYDETTIALIQNGEVMKRQSSVPLYKLENDSIVQADWNQVIVGTSEIQCVMENGQVCAVVIKESLPSDIRVIIKNGSSIFYSDLYIKKQSDSSMVHVNEVMSGQGLSTLEVTDSTGLVLCDAEGNPSGEAYEGSFRIIKTEDGLVLVNQLPIETYVKYVLPSEMPIAFHEEALKAQAVCARTFAYDQMSNQSYAMYGANLDDSTSFQVYHATGRYAESDAAVDATVGEIITCNGNLITCYYFSTSAGTTNDMTVWGSETPEYIGMCESQDTDSPFYRWKAYLDISEVQNDNYGALESVQVMSSNAAGYVTEVKLVYENETVTYTKENDIRRALGTYLQETVLNNGKVRTDLSMIPSANFKVAEVSDTRIVLEGGGFGHGIGMSQYGANQMAKAGFGYKAIIEHYYNNVIVKNI